MVKHWRSPNRKLLSVALVWIVASATLLVSSTSPIALPLSSAAEFAEIGDLGQTSTVPGTSPVASTNRPASSPAGLYVDAPATAAVGEAFVVEVSLAVDAPVGAAQLDVSAPSADVEPVRTITLGSDDLVEDRSVGSLGERAVLAATSCPRTGCDAGALATGAAGELDLGAVSITPRQPGVLIVDIDAPVLADPAGEPITFDGGSQQLAIAVTGGPVDDTAPTGSVPAPTTVAPPEVVAPPKVWEEAVDTDLSWRIDAVDGCDDASCTSIAEVQAQLSAPTASLEAVTAGSTFVVDSTSDSYSWDTNPGDGICRASGGGCTLRAAMAEANASAGHDVIEFALNGDGPHTIQLERRLPALTDETGGVTIDGYTQGGSAVNTESLTSDAQIMVEVRGSGPSAYDAFVIRSADNVIRGLAIYNARRPVWIFGAAADRNRIVGNFIGTDAAGVFGAGTLAPTAHGIHVEQQSADNIIGSPLLEDRNVVSGNARHGIGFWHGNTDNNVVQNNIVGLDPTGTRSLPNAKHGIDVNFNASFTQVGGSTPNAGNVVSGNNDSGIEVSHQDVTGTRVIGNLVGMEPDGESFSAETANANTGVYVEDGVESTLIESNVIGNNRKGGVRILNGGSNGVTTGTVVRNNLIGITALGTPIPNGQVGVSVDGSDSVIGPANVIAYTTGPAIVSNELDARRNTFTENAYLANTGRSIELAPPGSNPNDVDDVDDGPNGLLNWPVFDRSSVQIIEGRTCAACLVELYTIDPSAGQQPSGASFLAAATADPVTGEFAVANPGLELGEEFTATATDPEGNTSEFAAIQTIGLHSDAPSADAGPDLVVDEGDSAELTATGADPDLGDVTFEWDLDGDGVFETPGQTALFDASDLDGPVTIDVVVRVTDSTGLSATDTAVITVNNVAPTAILSSPTQVYEGAGYTISLDDATDVSVADLTSGLRFALVCAGEVLTGVRSGYATGDLELEVENWNSADGVRFLASGSNVIDNGLVRPLGDLGAGVVTRAGAGGTMYIAHSVEDIATRFATSPTPPSAAARLVAVSFDNGQWRYDNGAQLVPFEPRVTDLIVAEIDLDAQSFTLTEGSTGSVGGPFPDYSTASPTSARSCTAPGGPSTSMINALVFDDDGGVTALTAPIEVVNVGPIVTIEGDAGDRDEGVMVDLTISVSDPSDPDGPSGIVPTWTVRLDGVEIGTGTGNDVSFQLVDDGRWSVTASATDPNGATGSASLSFDAANVAPSATLTSSVDAGTEITVQLELIDIVDPGSADVAAGLRFGFACDGASLAGLDYETASIEPSRTCTFPLGMSAIPVSAVVLDDDDGRAEYTTTISASNAPPVLSVGAFTVAEGATTTVTASGQDPEGSPLFFEWDLDNDLDYESTGSTVVFDATTIDGPMVQRIGVRATDVAGLSTATTTTVTIVNVSPSITLTPFESVEGTPIVVDLSSATDPAPADEATLRYAVDCAGASLNEISYETATAEPTETCLFADGPASGTISVAVFDDDGGAVRLFVPYSILNAPPQPAVAAPTTTLVEGDELELAISVTDEGTADLATIGLSWTVILDGAVIGNGTGATVRLVLPDDGRVTVSAQATDKDGGIGVAEVDFDVLGAAPTATLSVPASADEGSVVPVSLLAAADAGPADTEAGLRFAFSCDGSPIAADYASAAASPNGSCFAEAPGILTIVGRVIDADEAFTDYVATVAIGNVAPVARAVFPRSIPAGSPFTIGTFDPSKTGLNFSFDCGDGFGPYVSSPSTSCSGLAPGVSRLGVRVRDASSSETEYTALAQIHRDLTGNGGFEIDADGEGTPDGWTLPGSGAVRVVSSSHGGAAALEQSTTTREVSLIRTDELVAPRTTYELSGWFQILGELGAAQLEVTFYDAGGRALLTSRTDVISGPTDGWVRLSRLIPAPNGSTAAKVRVEVITEADAMVRVDDVRLNHANELVNPDFDFDLDGDGRPDDWWQLSRFQRDGTTVHDTTYAGRVDGDGSGLTLGQRVQLIVPDRTYLVAASVATTPGAEPVPIRLRVRWKDAATNVIRVDIIEVLTESTPGWVQLGGTLVAPPNAAEANFEMRIANGLIGPLGVDSAIMALRD